MEAEENNCESTNLGFVATCVCYGSQVEIKDKSNKKKQKFLLTGTPKRVWILKNDEVEKLEEGITFEKLIHLFVSDSLMLPPNFFNKLTDIKSLLYD